MIQSTPADGNFGQYLISFLHDQRQKKANVNVSISKGCYDGSLQIRDGEIVSATAGSLSGNGAVMTLAMMESAQLSSSLDSSSLPKTVYLTPDQVEKLLAAVKKNSAGIKLGKEEQLLEEAKLLFFQYRYKEAGEKISTILRTNRFFYPAWLWQSRLVRRPAYILKAIDEAYRWGNHDREIWREARKMRPQLVSNQAETSQRCFFCWSLVDETGQCTHCRTRLIVSEHGHADKVLAEEIKQTVAEFERAYKQDPQNGRVAYSLAVGYFHLGFLNKALQFLQSAVRISPRSVVFRKSLNALGGILKAEKRKQQATQAVGRAPANLDAKGVKNILVVEESQTTQKILSMQFAQAGHKFTEAATGVDALTIARVHNFDLIVLGAMLPDTNGYDLIRQLKAIGHLKLVPVIMLAGQGDEDLARGKKAGVDEYLTKPFDPAMFTVLVEKYLHKSAKKVAQEIKKAPAAESPVKSKKTAEQPSKRETQPVAQLSKAQDRPAPVVEPAASQPVETPANTIFIIEDSPTSRKVLSMVLGRNGFNVVEATTGEEAIRLAATTRPALVLLDVMLPDMTGYDVLPKLREMPYYSELPVVMLTGRKGSEDRMRGMMVGTNEYLTKPFNPEKLISVIKNYI